MLLKNIWRIAPTVRRSCEPIKKPLKQPALSFGWSPRNAGRLTSPVGGYIAPIPIVEIFPHPFQFFNHLIG
jgi:hypothetical protein